MGGFPWKQDNTNAFNLILEVVYKVGYQGAPLSVLWVLGVNFPKVQRNRDTVKDGNNRIKCDWFNWRCATTLLCNKNVLLKSRKNLLYCHKTSTTMLFESIIKGRWGDWTYPKGRIQNENIKRFGVVNIDKMKENHLIMCKVDWKVHQKWKVGIWGS